MCREAGAIEIVLSSFCCMTLAMVSLMNLVIFISFAIINEAAEFVMVVQDQQRFWASIAKLNRLCRYRPTYCPQGSRFCGACWTFVILRAWVEDEEKYFSYNYELPFWPCNILLLIFEFDFGCVQERRGEIIVLTRPGRHF